MKGFLGGLFSGKAKDNKASRPLPKKTSPSTKLELIDSFHTKIVGVTFKNTDGSDRQRILAECKKGERLKLIHSPIPQDEFAVKVCRKNGKQLGHLRSELAADIAPLLDEGVRIEALVANITGGTKAQPTRGCNIEICQYE